MTDYRSLLERDLDRARPAGFTFDDLSRRRDRKRRGQRVSAMTAALVIVALGIAALVWAWGPDGPVPADRPVDPFVGTWESIDLDGSAQRMTIRGPEDGIYQIEVVDDMSSVCGGTPATASGTGTLATRTRMTISQTYTCEDGTVHSEIEGIRLDDWSLVYDPATDTLADPTEVVWHREGAERIPVPIPEGAVGHTVETSLGTWTWTWIPEEVGASRHWNQALQQHRTDDVPARAQFPETPAPQIAGMTWGEWWEERVARSGEVTVAAVSRNGEIDWSAVYDGDDLWTEWRHQPTTTVGIHEGWIGPLIAVLEVRLAPGDPEGRRVPRCGYRRADAPARRHGSGGERRAARPPRALVPPGRPGGGVPAGGRCVGPAPDRLGGRDAVERRLPGRRGRPRGLAGRRSHPPAAHLDVPRRRPVERIGTPPAPAARDQGGNPAVARRRRSAVPEACRCG